LEKH